MTAAELIIARPLGMTERELFLLLADSVYIAQLSDGRRVIDAIDFREWLLELAEASGKEGEILGEQNLPRHDFNLHATCARCGHMHQGEQECGESMGGGRICRCEEKVPA